MGEDGAKRVVVNSVGREISTLEEIQATEGRRIQLRRLWVYIVLVFTVAVSVASPVKARKSTSIVEFADLGRFIDAPLKTYSSGMRARLGFSIATAVDPDVLLIDEVLATGDAVFRAKSRQRIIELTRAAKAIVLVTHDMGWVTEFCNRAMLLDHGHVILEGDPAEVVKLHEERSEKARIEREAELAAKLAAVEGTRAGAAG